MVEGRRQRAKDKARAVAMRMGYGDADNEDGVHASSVRRRWPSNFDKVMEEEEEQRSAMGSGQRGGMRDFDSEGSESHLRRTSSILASGGSLLTGSGPVGVDGRRAGDRRADERGICAVLRQRHAYRNSGAVYTNGADRSCTGGGILAAVAASVVVVLAAHHWHGSMTPTKAAAVAAAAAAMVVLLIACLVKTARISCSISWLLRQLPCTLVLNARDTYVHSMLDRCTALSTHTAAAYGLYGPYGPYGPYGGHGGDGGDAYPISGYRGDEYRGGRCSRTRGVVYGVARSCGWALLQV
jgi:hypothetical protein